MAYRYTFGFSLRSIAVAAALSCAAFARAACDNLRQLGESIAAFTMAVVRLAFPSAPRIEPIAVAATPRVLGLHRTRAFRQRVLDHLGSWRRQHPLAFAAAA